MSISDRRYRLQVRPLLCVVFTFIGAFSILTRVARAERGPDSLPEPITLNQAEHISTFLELSTEQSFAVQRLHEEYASNYQQVIPRMNALRENFATLWSSNAALTVETRLENYRKCHYERRQIFEVIASLDSAFFDGLLPIVTDSQKEKIERVRLRRERERLRGESMLQMQHSPVIDLIEVEIELAKTRKLNRPESPEVNRILNDYESRLLSLERKLQRGTDMLYVEMCEKLIAWGETSTTVQDDTEEGQNSRALAAEIWLEITARPRKAVRQIRDLNRITCNQLAALEAPGAREFARALRHEFFLQSFRDSMLIEILEAVEGWDDLLINAAETTEPKQLEACKSIAQAHQGKLDKSLNDLIEALTEIDEVELPGNVQSASDEVLADHTFEARDAMASTTALLENLLGQAQASRLLNARKTAVSRGPDAHLSEYDRLRKAAAAQTQPTTRPAAKSAEQ